MNPFAKLFGKKPPAAQDVSPSADRRYASNPIALFFESYVLDVLGQLPTEKSEKIQSLNLQKVFKTEASEWRDVIREALHLSPTIDIAILDLWYTNQGLARQRKVEYSAIAFAQDFHDQYLKEDSKVDVWTPETLEAAKARVAVFGRPPQSKNEA
ncbi:MAG TPA: hypothetical protein VH394_17155 [Thermoanaerobaculia bacterium]|jgi:hypothetical protein|nr:hypothetical protein [Thermoanaerobaculia bacterium]